MREERREERRRERGEVRCGVLSCGVLSCASLRSVTVLETATRSKKHETIVEGQRLRTADIMARLRFFVRK